MPNVPNTTITERIGVYYAGYLFSLSGVIFRETPNTDVGIDAQIELVNKNGVASGKLAGIQIKSGDSFVNTSTQTFTLRSEQKHFEYWSRYSLPVIGIVYSTSLEKAVWFNLTERSKQVLEEGGPYRVADIATDKNELTKENIASAIVNLIHNHYREPVSTEQIRQITQIQESQVEDISEETKEAAWKRLTNILLASNSEREVLVDAGYRLSWYFPTVTQEQRDFFIKRISSASDEEITNVIMAISQTLSDDRDDVAEVICDLLSYIPNQVGRLKILGRRQIVHTTDLEALFQTIEHFTQDFESEFRQEILKLYGIKDTDISQELF